MKKFLVVLLCVAGVLSMTGAANAAIAAGSKTVSSTPSAGTVQPVVRVKGKKQSGKKTAGNVKPASAPKKGSVDSAKSRKVTAKTGETFNVQLISNASTGYSWKVVSISNPKAVEFVKSSYSASNTGSSKKVIGASGRETLVFKALVKGTAKIVVGYARSWEKGTKPAKTITVDVTVK